MPLSPEEPVNQSKSRFEDDALVDEAVKAAVRNALAQHRRNGQTVAIWREGAVQLVHPSEALIREGDEPA